MNQIVCFEVERPKYYITQKLFIKYLMVKSKDIRVERIQMHHRWNFFFIQINQLDAYIYY